jgi:hypothetical protein
MSLANAAKKICGYRCDSGARPTTSASFTSTDWDFDLITDQPKCPMCYRDVEGRGDAASATAWYPSQDRA